VRRKLAWERFGGPPTCRRLGARKVRVFFERIGHFAEREEKTNKGESLPINVDGAIGAIFVAILGMNPAAFQRGYIMIGRAPTRLIGARTVIRRTNREGKKKANAPHFDPVNYWVPTDLLRPGTLDSDTTNEQFVEEYK